MRILVIAFLLSALAIIYCVHYFIFHTAGKFIGFGNVNTRGWLAGILFLSISFILSTFLAHATNSQIAKTIYYIFSSWYGAVVYLLFFSLVIWLIYFFAGFFSFNLPMRAIASILYITVFILVFYGIFNAANTRVVELSIEIEDLPEHWRGKTLVHISDVHMGAINSATYMEKLARKINELKPDLVLITGDYFDGTCSRFEKLAAPLSEIKTSEGIYFVKGNHETYASRNIKEGLCGILSEAGVTCLKNEAIDIKGLKIVGLDYPFGSDSIALLKNINPEEPSILLYHEPRLINEAKSAGINLQLAGHTHKGQLFPFSFFTRLIYNKYHYGLISEDSYNIYTSSGAGTWGPPMRIGTKSEIVKIIIN